MLTKPLLEENTKEKQIKENRTSEKDLKQKVEKINKQKEEKNNQQNTINNNFNKKNILKSSVLKNEKNLNLMAKGSFLPIKINTKTFEVLKIQEALIKIGFNLIKATGDFDNKTETAIKTFQNKYKPTHNTHKNYKIYGTDGIVDKHTILALDEAIIEKWIYNPEKIIDDGMDNKWLTVPYGQLTFDLEGGDNESSAYFSRKAHVPNNLGIVIGNSGVTLGRGLDLGTPPTGASGQSPSSVDLSLLFESAKLTPKLNKWLLSVKGKTKENALTALNNSGLTDKEMTITRKQQHLMFKTIYAYFEEKTRILMTKYDVEKAYGKVDWDGMPRKVKDVLIDITYRGDSTGSSSGTRSHYVPALAKDNGSIDYTNFIEIMNESSQTWTNVPIQRRKKRDEYL